MYPGPYPKLWKRIVYLNHFSVNLSIFSLLTGSLLINWGPFSVQRNSSVKLKWQEIFTPKGQFNMADRCRFKIKGKKNLQLTILIFFAKRHKFSILLKLPPSLHHIASWAKNRKIFKINDIFPWTTLQNNYDGNTNKSTMTLFRLLLLNLSLSHFLH